MSNWIKALEAEIEEKKSELDKLQDVIRQIDVIKSDIKRLESIHAQAIGKAPAKSGGAGKRAPRTPEQKAAQAERMKASWAAKKSGKK